MYSYLAFPAIHNEHIQRELVQCIECMRLTNVQVQITLRMQTATSVTQMLLQFHPCEGMSKPATIPASAYQSL